MLARMFLLLENVGNVLAMLDVMQYLMQAPWIGCDLFWMGVTCS